MKVTTPGQLAQNTGSKYLGVLVAAKYARNMNEFRALQRFEPGEYEAAGPQDKLTSVALDKVAEDAVEFQLVERVRDEI
jgi:DNA-directed RNA polymerase omega subunit